MSYTTDLLADARRRALLTGRPLSSQESNDIVQAGAQGAGERALATQKLAMQRLEELRQQKVAKKAMVAQEKQQQTDAVGNALTIDQMTGGKGQGALLAGLRMGSDSLLKLAGSPLNTSGILRAGTDAMGKMTNGLIGTTPLAASLAPNAVTGLYQTAAPGAINGTANLMTMLGAKPAMSLAGTTAGNMAANTAANAGANAVTQAGGQGISGILGPLVNAVKPISGVANYVAAADASRNIWGGDLDRNYDKAGWSQKIARTPLANTGVPGFGATEIEVSKAIGGKNNFVSKFQGKANEEMSRLEEKVVGKPLDKIFGAVGKIFCHAAGTMFKMADGTIKAVEDIKIGDIMLEGGKVFAVGQCELTDLWNYKGARVSPEHAVLENGSWVRVKDSQRAKPIDSEIPVVVYPICNENHVMIGENGSIWADFAETDQGTSVNDAERLEYMNNDKETIEYLGEKYGC